MDLLSKDDLLIAIYINKEIELPLKLKSSLEYHIDKIKIEKYTGVTQEDIIDIVCHYYKIEKKYLNKKTRKSNIVLARQIIWYLIKKYKMQKSLEMSGAIFGLDHATVSHGIKRIYRLIDVDKIIIEDVGIISNSIDFLIEKQKSLREL